MFPAFRWNCALLRAFSKEFWEFNSCCLVDKDPCCSVEGLLLKAGKLKFHVAFRLRIKTGYYEYLLKICMSIRPFAFHASLESDIHLCDFYQQSLPTLGQKLLESGRPNDASRTQFWGLSAIRTPLSLKKSWRSTDSSLSKIEKTPNQTSETIQNHKQLVISSILEMFLWKHVHVQATRYLAHLEVRNSSQLLTGLPSSHHWWSWACLQPPKEGLSQYA